MIDTDHHKINREIENMSAAVEETNRSNLNIGSAGDLGTGSVDTIEELTKEVEALKKKLEEERAKFNDVACKCADKMDTVKPRA